MDNKYLAEIKARTSAELTDDDYRSLRISDIAKIRMDSKRLVAEVERLTVVVNSATSENATLKKALELMAKDFYDASDDETHVGPEGLVTDYVKWVTQTTHAESEG